MSYPGSGRACLRSWLGMVNAGWLCSMRSEIFLQMKFIKSQGCSTKLPVYLGSLLHIISFLFCHFRSWGIFQTTMDKWVAWWNEFWQFANEKTWFKISSGSKNRRKNGITSPLSPSLSVFMVLKLLKIVSFSQFFADIRKKSKTVREVYVYASESFCFTLSQLLFSWYFILNIMWTANISDLFQ